MEILITTFTYPPNRDGCAEAMAVLAEGMARRGHKVTVATGFHPGRASNAPDANPRVEQFEVAGSYQQSNGIRGETEAYRDFLRSRQWDIAVFQNWETWNTYLAVSLFKEMKAKKVVASTGYPVHIWNRYHKFPWGLASWFRGLYFVLKTPGIMRQLDHAVFLSRRRDWNRFFDHRLARAIGYRKYSIIPNGAFSREFNGELPDFRGDFGIGAGPMLLCVANYCERKNQALAARAFRRAQLDGATLVLIGSEFNEYSEQVRRWDEELRPTMPAGRVLLLEKVPRVKTCAAYRAADLFVLSAKVETQPIVLLEAMASHTPWISTNTGCVAELPGGIAVRSEEEMVEKIKAMMADQVLRKRLSEEGWAASQKTYDWDQVVAAYERLFLRLCGMGPR